MDIPDISELKEIKEYNGNEEFFKKYIIELNKRLKFKTIYHDKNKKIKKYTGNIINGYYEGRGILYNEEGKMLYNGYFENGLYEGFGREYHGDKLVYEGFFSKNKYNGKGTLYEGGIKKYEGNFISGEFEGVGIEYFPNGNRIRKMKYIYGCKAQKSYGILYDENNKEIYCGLLINGNPKEGKNITIYRYSGDKLYKGDFSSYKYNGKGIYYDNSNKILFEGIFKDDQYFNGILYDENGNKKY